MGGIATIDKKGFHFQKFGLTIFVIAAKAAKVQKLGVCDGLLVWFGWEEENKK